MSKKIVDETHAKETLKEMIEDRKQGEPVEEVLANLLPEIQRNYGNLQRILRPISSEGRNQRKIT